MACYRRTSAIADYNLIVVVIADIKSYLQLVTSAKLVIAEQMEVLEDKINYGFPLNHT